MGLNQHKFQRMDKGQPRISAQRTRLTNGDEAIEPEHIHPAVIDALQPRTEAGRYATVIPAEDRPEIVSKAILAYSSGTSIRQIAEEYNVTRETMYSWILAETGPKEYNHLITGALTSKIAKADDALELADSPLDLARAREMARFSRMDYERRRPHLYGVKQEITNVTPPPIMVITITTTVSNTVGSNDTIPDTIIDSDT